jgi:hypothetical protein
MSYDDSDDEAGWERAAILHRAADPATSPEMRELVDKALKAECRHAIANDEHLEKALVAREAARASLLSAIRVLETERDKAREFVAFCITDGSFQGLDIDGGDAQDKAQELGLIIEVPADEEFRAEYDSDTMFVLAWRARTEEASR